MNTIQKKWIAAALALSVIGIGAQNIRFRTAAEETQTTDTITEEEAVQKVVTEYEDLWKGTITFKAGEPAAWYVHVPDDTEPKGCGATIKIPGLGWGTEERNKEEGHLTLTQGDNLVYTFTPESGDYLFTCWMGSGCHASYIHVTEDGTYTAELPADPTDIRAERNGSTATVSFTAPDAPDNASITGYKIYAADPDGKRTKTLAQESPVTLENLDPQKAYTIQIITLATSGQSAGEQTVTLAAEPVPETTEPSPAATDTTETSVAAAETTAVHTAPDHPSETTVQTGTVPQSDPTEQEIITDYADLWKGTITVRQGVPVRWYVYVPEDTVPKGCGATIKIPGLGWGTDTNNKDENHLTLQPGKNFIYAFTPQTTEDILVTCWMGSGCHHNYIHVSGGAAAGSSQTESVAAASAAETAASAAAATANSTVTASAARSGSRSEVIVLGAAASVSAAQAQASADPVRNDPVPVKAYTDVPSPKTGETDPTGIKLLLTASVGLSALLYKRRRKDDSDIS